MISLVVFTGHIAALAKLGGRDSLVIGEKLQKGFIIGEAEIRGYPLERQVCGEKLIAQSVHSHIVDKCL